MRQPFNHRVIRSRWKGFSLTELMVATALFASATAGAVTAISRSHAIRRDAGSSQQLHERAQYVLATLEPELQMAGYFGDGPAPAALATEQVPEAARRCGAGIVSRLDLPLQSLPGWNLPCDARGGGAMAGSDVLIVRRLSARTAARAEAGRAQWLADGARPEVARLYWNGEAPLNPAPAAGAPLRELLVRIYYVAHAADGDASMPALRVKSLTSIAGVPGFIDTEVMNGIEQLRVELLPSATAPRAVRVQLRVRAEGARRGAAQVPESLEVSRLHVLRNARD
jgi:prepilin-type N-terminal cleavage/methylation domain-containing protein